MNEPFPPTTEDNDALSRWWDRLNAGKRADSTSDCDPVDVETVRRLRELDDQPVPDVLFRSRLWEDLMERSGGAVALPVYGVVNAPLNGRVRGIDGVHPAPVRLPQRGDRAGRMLSFAGAAALIAAILVFAVITFDQRDHAILPPAQATPTSELVIPAGDWPTLRGDMARTGGSSNEGPIGELGPSWTFLAPDALSAPVKVGDTVYVTSTGGLIYALDAVSGAQRWTFDMGSIAPNADQVSTTTVVDGMVYVGSAGGLMFGLDATNGTKVWEYNAGVEINSTPAVVNGTVLFGDLAGAFYSLDAATGSQLWKIELGSPASKASPAYANGIVYQGTEDATFFAIDATNGAIVWQRTFDGSSRMPTIMGGYLLVSTRDGVFRALDPMTGEDRWSYVPGDGLEARAGSVWAGMLVVNVDGDSTVGIDIETGSVVWSFKHLANGSTVSIGNGIAYVPDDEQNLVALDVTTGAQVGSGAPGPGYISAAAIGTGVVYVGTADGALVALVAQTGTPEPGQIVTAEAQATPVSADATPVSLSSDLSATLLWSVDIVEGAQVYDDGISLRLAPDGTVWLLGDPIKIFDRDGELKESWGVQGEGPGEFNWKMDVADGWWGDVAFAPDGTFWIAECGNERVEHFAADRTLIGSFGQVGFGDGQFRCPTGIVIASNGDLIVSDLVANRVQRFSPDGQFIADFGSFAGPIGLSFDADGNLIVAEGNSGKLTVIAPDGSRIGTIGSVGTDAGTLRGPFIAAFAKSGQIVVTNQDTDLITVFNPDGSPVGSISLGALTGDPNATGGSIELGGNGAAYLIAYVDGNPRFLKLQLTLPEVPPAG